MWAVVGIWDIDADLIESIREQVPLMASSKINYPGFVHGVWTMTRTRFWSSRTSRALATIT